MLDHSGALQTHLRMARSVGEFLAVLDKNLEKTVSSLLESWAALVQIFEKASWLEKGPNDMLKDQVVVNSYTNRFVMPEEPRKTSAARTARAYTSVPRTQQIALKKWVVVSHQEPRR